MNTPSSITINGITLTGPRAPRQNEVLTADALSFLAELHREFGPRVEALDAMDGASEQALGEAEDFAASWHALIEKQLAERPARSSPRADWPGPRGASSARAGRSPRGSWTSDCISTAMRGP